MNETIKAITENGILVVIAAVFIWTILADRKDNTKREIEIKERDDTYNTSLSLLSKAIDNMANLIDLLRQSNDNQASMLKTHDERSIKIKEEMTEIKTIVGGCNKRK